MTKRYSYFVAELERGRGAFDAFTKHMLDDKDTISVFAPQLASPPTRRLS